MELARPVKTKITNEMLTIQTEFGYTLYYKLIPDVWILPGKLDKDGHPYFTTGVSLEYIKAEPTEGVMELTVIQEATANRSIIPPLLNYTEMFLGFVYADASNPQNHKWWLDFRNAAGDSIYHLYTNNLTIACPFTTTSWWASDFYHGRFVFSKTDIDKVIETDDSFTIVSNNKKPKLDPTKACTTQTIPIDIKYLQLRYSPRDDMWYCDSLKEDMIPSSTVGVKSILCDVPGISNILNVTNKPKVSIIIDATKVSLISITLNSLIIRGK